MLALKVYLNDRLVTIAGAEDLAVLTQVVTAVGKLGPTSQGAQRLPEGCEVQLTVSGMTSHGGARPDTHLAWAPRVALKAGDVVKVQLLEAESTDPPIVPTPEEVETTRVRAATEARRRYESAKRYYFEYKQKFEDGHTPNNPLDRSRPE